MSGCLLLGLAHVCCHSLAHSLSPFVMRAIKKCGEAPRHSLMLFLIDQTDGAGGFNTALASRLDARGRAHKTNFQVPRFKMNSVCLIKFKAWLSPAVSIHVALIASLRARERTRPEQSMTGAKKSKLFSVRKYIWGRLGTHVVGRPLHPRQHAADGGACRPPARPLLIGARRALHP